jgi:hypothetical protein
MTGNQQLGVFATPSLSHTVSLDYLMSWTNTVWLLKEAGMAHGRIDRGGDCFVAKVRNKFVQDFLDGPGTDLFFLDDDIGWPAPKAVEFLSRGEPIIAGIYPKRTDETDWGVGLLANAETGDLIMDQGLVAASFAATGFMRIKREVLETLAKDAKRFMDIEVGGKVSDYPLIFESGLDADGWWCGEDVSFCRKARAAGYDIWVDPDIPFRHRGGKTWKGTLADHLDTFRKRGKLAMAEKHKEAAE